MSATMTTGERAAAIASRYVGTPFRHQGRLPGIGLDCAGVVVCSYAEAGVALRDRLDYRRLPDSRILLAALLASRFRPVTDRQDGDVLLFWMRGKRDAIHVGMRRGGGMIHAEHGCPVSVVPVAGYWSRRLVGVYRRAA